MARLVTALIVATLLRGSIAGAGVSSATATHAAASRAATTVTPIQKVLQLLEDMLAKGTKEKQEEETKFAAFEQWCGDKLRVKTDEIAVGTEKIEKLSAQIEKAAVRIKQLTARIEELEEDVGRWKKDQKSATDVRDKEKADYVATANDYTESIDALTQAIAVLRKQAYDRPQAEVQQALVQVQSLRLVPPPSKAALSAFLQQAQPDLVGEDMPSERLTRDSPEANAYEFQSGGVIEMLAKLKVEFRSKKSDLDAEELNAQHAYEQMMQQLNDNIENAEHEISKKTMARGETGQAKAQHEGELAQTKTDRDEDQKYKDDTEALCTLKKNDYESRQKLRGEEIEQLRKAIEIISSDEVSGAGEKHLPALMQIHGRRGVALAQLRGDQQSPLQSRIALFLGERAKLSGSQMLSEVAERVQNEPFTKVKKMIKDLIVKLMEESTAETEHKGWCDTELATNKQTRDAKTEQIQELNSEIEELTAKIADLTQDLADLAAAIAQLDAAMGQAEAERAASKETNEQTIKEAKEAQLALEQAIALLKDYYSKASEATALAQQAPAEDAPETFDKPYKGMFPEGGSVIDFLEVILTDFARLESETAAAEAQEQEDFKKFMFDSEKDKALKENEVEHKTDMKTDKESALHTAEMELKTTQQELDEAVNYYDKLKPTCVDAGVTYEERVKQREAEIQSLQEALSILTGVGI